MASGKGRHDCSFVGVAADVTVYLPFNPSMVYLWADSGTGTIEAGIKYSSMSGAAYLSTTTGTDAGVTINTNNTLTIANGADINVAAATVYISAWE